MFLIMITNILVISCISMFFRLILLISLLLIVFPVFLILIFLLLAFVLLFLCSYDIKSHVRNVVATLGNWVLVGFAQQRKQRRRHRRGGDPGGL